MKTHRLPLALRLSVGIITGLVAATAFAEKADHDKPTNIVYDRANWDDLKQVYVFTGNVILTKGTIVVRSDKLTIHQDPEGYDFAIATMNEGNPRQVYFHEKREGYADQYIEGVGDRIEYDEKADTVKIFTRAVVKRLEADVTQDEVHGDTIDYNSLTEIYRVDSGPGKPARTILAPAKPATPATAPGATALKPGDPTAAKAVGAPAGTAPAAPASGSGSTGGNSATTPGSATPAPPDKPLKPADTLSNKPE